MLSQKDNAKCASRTGTLASSTARAGTSCEMIQQKTRSTSSPFSISSLSRTFTSGKAGRTVTGTGRKKVLENTTMQINFRSCVENEDYSNIHDPFIRDTWFRKTMLEFNRTDEVIREMDKLANENHTHIATEEELDVYRGNWWIRSNFVGSDTMPIRHRPDFKEALSPLHRLKKVEDESYYQNWWQALPHHGGKGKITGGIPHMRHHHDDGLDTDRTGKPAKISESLFTCGMSLKMNLVQNYSDHFGNSQRSSPSPTGGAKSTSPTTETGYENWQPDGEMVDRSGQLDVTRKVIEAHSNFSEDIQTERVVDLMSVTPRAHRLGLYLKSKDRRLSRVEISSGDNIFVNGDEGFSANRRSQTGEVRGAMHRCWLPGARPELFPGHSRAICGNPPNVHYVPTRGSWAHYSNPDLAGVRGLRT